ncbi:MAG TPA: efflux RND transporter permease subunit [bacterium]|nr:efflux RND transporter permease subunit [bacterium]HPN43686.1 efflux RND transporter permease subunit [bacterium]
MNFFGFVIKRRVLISMLFIGFSLLGLISYKLLPVELYPNAELPFLIVQVGSIQEVNPEYLETKAVIPVEGAITTLEGVDKIETFVENRQGAIFVYFNQKTKIKYAYLKLEEKINAVKASLGDEFNIQVLKVDTDQVANQFMTLQVRGGSGLNRVREVIDRKVTPELENIEGIANVEIYGGQEKSVEIILNEDVCRAYNISPNRVRSLLMSNNSYKAFVGKVYDNDRYFFVNTVADYTSVQDIESIIVDADGPLYLRDIAGIKFGVKEQTNISRVNGKEAITVQLVRDTQVNLIDLSHRTRAVIKQLNSRLASDDVEIVIQSDSAEIVEKNINLIIQLALVGGFLSVLILWLFLRNLQLVLTIALSMPISIFTAFNFFYAFDLSINSLTLVGIALAVGMLLDNSVVVLENIYRIFSHNKDIDNAVIRGTTDVWRSILASTLTTVTVFLPFTFAANFMVKLLGKHVGISIVSTLGVSLLVAFLLVPMAAHFILQRLKKNAFARFQLITYKNRLLQIYNVILKSCLRNPARTIIGAIVFFFFSLLVCVALSLNISKETESREFNLYLTMSSGATLESTDAATTELEEKLQQIEEKEEIISTINEEDATVTVKLKENYYKIKHRSIPDIKSMVEKNINDFRAADVSFDQPQSGSRYRGGMGRNPGASLERMLGIGSQTEQIIIKGADFDIMSNTATDIQSYLEQLTNISSVSLNISDNRPEIHLLFDNHLLSEYDVTLSSIATELSTFQNEFSSNLRFKQGTEEYDIIIKSDNEKQKTFDDLNKVRVASASGGEYELETLSRIVYSQGLASINRVNQEKQIEITYRFSDEVNSSKQFLVAARAEVDQLIEQLSLPPGIAVEVVHEENTLKDFYFLIAATFILIFMILASVFESLSTPLVIMFTIPLAAIGSLWALILTGNSITNVNSLIGFVILLGVVVNNGIIFIDYTRILIKRKYHKSRALIMAGQARVRPILITAITTIIAMLPLALGKAEYVSQIGAPFAITVIGGLTVSTLFTLIFIPTFFSGLDASLHWLQQLPWKIEVLHAVLLVSGCLLIYYRVDSIIWRFIDFFILLLLIPAITLFIMKSLRRARTDLIGANTELKITVRHLVKIYDDDSRFVREWKKGKKIREHAGIKKEFKTRNDFESLLWELPLLGFLIYFTYFYLKNYFWMFVFAHPVYFYTLYLVTPLLTWFYPVKKAALIRKILFWGIPLLNLVFFYLRWEKLVVLFFIALIWYLALAIYTTSNRLLRDKVDIVRLQGKFKTIRQNFYRLVQIIPVIGKKKNPFRALNGVSLEIGSGMFGLLGPNGAGKTTLMRIICGILQQSRGKIWVNEFEINEKREELQGLIGYLPQEFGMYENMTAWEYLDYQALLKGIYNTQAREERINYVLSAVHMQESRDVKIESYSGGMKQRIGIAQTLLHLPRILVVDEPTAGLDPRERIRFRNLLVELGRERIVIFSTHIIEDIASSCNKVAVLNQGALCYLGTPADMVNVAQNNVWQFFLEPAIFEDYTRDMLVLHHMRVDDKIRVRCLANAKPHEDAIQVKPTLEDAYLMLLRNKH